MRTLILSLLFFSSFSFAKDGVFIAEINDAISPASEAYLKYAIKEAHAEEAKLLVVVLNTPGGLVSSMQTMVSDLLQSPVPTAVFVHPPGSGAISAGVFITLAGNVAAMAPGTNIGAAHPVAGDGQDIQGDMREKMENTIVSLGKAISEQRNRNFEWVEKAIRESVAITDQEAKSKGVIDVIARDVDDLLAQLDGKTIEQNGKSFILTGLNGATKEVVEPTFKQSVLFLLADPNLAVFLSIIGIGGLILEFYTPGLIAPGVIGAVCLVLSITASGVLPITGGGVVLLVLGMIFFIVELMSPSFGVFGFTGVISMLLGGIYLIDESSIWGAPGLFEVSLTSLIAVAVFMLLVVIGISTLMLKTRNLAISSGREAMLGKKAIVKKSFKYNSQLSVAEGRVLINGELWKAVSDDLPEKGEVVIVSEIEGLTLNVIKESN